MGPPADSLFRTLDTRYGRLTIFANDIGAASQSLASYGEWAENELSFLHAMIREDETVLDVGAYIGTHTLAFASFVGRRGHVVAIEPQTHTFEVLKGNVEANGLDNVRLVNAVASGTVGEAIIPSIDIGQRESFGSASLRDTLTSAGGAVMQDGGDLVVRSITVDSIELASLALIKIDAEGMEDQVLRGAGATIRSLSPIVYAECNSLEDGLKSLQLLRQFDYRVFAHVVDAFNPDNFHGSSSNIFNMAREVALVGVPGRGMGRIESYKPRSCELLLEIRTADDLALALLNKPQYRPEVLRDGAAAKSGGSAYLDKIDGAQLEVERLGRDIAFLQEERQHSHDRLNVLHHQIESERIAAQQVREALQGKVDALCGEVEALQSKVDASILQAGLIRKEADRLRAENAALLQRAKAAEAAGWWQPMAWGRALSGRSRRKHDR